MSRIRPPYPSDLSDAQWILLEPLLASSERRARPQKWPPCAALLMCRLVPVEKRLWLEDVTQGIPTAWQTVSTTTFASGASTGDSDRRLRQAAPTGSRPTAYGGSRDREGREPEPTAAVIDSQALKGTGVVEVPSADTMELRASPAGSATCAPPARRHTGGLVLGARVHAANLSRPSDGAQGKGC